MLESPYQPECEASLWNTLQAPTVEVYVAAEQRKPPVLVRYRE
jgi:hypothetical protein